MSEENVISLRQIADEAGVSRMAVSLALRGKPGVSEETRSRVVHIAEELGYQPDPEIANLMARIKNRPKEQNTATMALLTSGDNPDSWKLSITERKYVEGAKARAREYGYLLEEHWVNDPDVSTERLFDILWNRGIEGVVVAPLQGRLSEVPTRSLPFEFNRFSAVAISETLIKPRINSVLHDQYNAILTVLKELSQLGYTKPGLVIQNDLNLRTNGKWYAGYYHYISLHGRQHFLPPLLLAELDGAAFKRWYKKHQPDSIISVDLFGIRLIEDLGLTMPDEIGYASLDLDGTVGRYDGISGIDQNSLYVGATAIDMLINTIQRNSKGIPTHPIRTEVAGNWVAGNSLRTMKA